MAAVAAVAWAALQPTVVAAQEAGVARSSAVLELDHFVDGKGEAVAFDPLYETTFGTEWRAPRYGWAVLEMALLLAVGTAGYGVYVAAIGEGEDGPGWPERLAARFDNDQFSTNFVLHPVAGAAYHGFARTLGLGVPASFAYGALSSATWEFALEVGRRASLNDLVVTPFAGLAVGEFLFHLMRYLNSAPGGGGRGQKAAAWTLGLPFAAHDAIYDFREPPPVPPDDLGLSSAYWHRFRLGYGLARLTNDEDRSDVLHGPALEAELVAMPGFLRPGRISTTFAHGNFTDGRLRLAFDGKGLAEAEVWTGATLAGYYTQDVRREHGRRWGHAAMVGLHSGFRFAERNLLDRDDRYAIVNLPGPAGEVRFAWRDVWLRFGAEAHLDVAGVRPAALTRYVGLRGNAGLKTVLRESGYLYAWGSSGRARVALELYGCELGAELFYGWYGSIEGVDELQERVDREAPSHDQVLEPRGWVGCTPPGGVLDVRLEVSGIRRWGEMGDVEATRANRRFGAAVGAKF